MPTLQELADRWYAAHPDVPRPDPSAARAPWTPPVPRPEPEPQPAHRGRSVEAKHRSAARRLGMSWQTYRRHIRNGQRWCSGHLGWHPAGDFADTRSYCGAWRRAYSKSWRLGVTLVPGGGG